MLEVLCVCLLFAILLLWSALSSHKTKLRLLEHQLLAFREAGKALEYRMASLEQWGHALNDKVAATHEQLGRATNVGVTPPGGAPPVTDEASASAETRAPAPEDAAPEDGVQPDKPSHVSAAEAEGAALTPDAAAKQGGGESPSATVGRQATPKKKKRKRKLADGRQGSRPAAAEPATAQQAGPKQPQPDLGPQQSAGQLASVGLEQWIGVRGAAALGALLLVLAGVYFFKYSIEHNLIPPAVRVVIGTLVGVACIAAAELKLRRSYEVLSNWLSGAGAAVLYLTFWASTAMYDLISTTVAGVLMVLVTATCGVLTVKRGSMAIAGLGLLGGFATPLLLSTGSDRPVTLFSYLFLLDGALLYVAHRRRWPLLALGSLLGTAGYQMAWVTLRMGPERVGWGMMMTVVFAVLFAGFSMRASADQPDGEAGLVDEQQKDAWRFMEITGVLLPFAFALFFSVQAEMLPSLPMLMAYLAVLVVGATAVGVRSDSGWLPAAAGGTTLGVLAGWLLTHPVNGTVAMQLCAGAVLFAIGAHVPLEVPRWRERDGLRVAAPIWLFGVWALMFITVVRAVAGTSPWAWLASWTVLSALALRQAEKQKQSWMYFALPVAWMLSLWPLAESHLDAFGPHGSTWFAMLLVSVCALMQGGLLLAKDKRREASHAASLATLLLVVPLIVADPPFMTLAAATVLLAAMSAIACTRHGVGAWALSAAVLLAIVQFAGWKPTLSVGDKGGLLPYATHATTAALLSVWPLLLNAKRRNTRSPWRTSAVVPWVFFLPMLVLHERLYGFEMIAPLPLAMALIPVGILLLLRRVGPRDADVKNSAIVWLAASSLSFITVAIPLQLENEWVTIGWALQGAALLALWRQRDHAGLKWYSLALFAAVTVRLVGNPWVLDYHPRSSMRVINWISYSYLVPVACLLSGARILSKLEQLRLRPSERAFTLGGKAVAYQALVLAALAVVFVWLNLTIIDWYAPGRVLKLDLERLPARDLTMSISWGIYALLLLGIGVWRKSSALRKVSLVMILVTCGKVFLYDLSHLRELYRVMSLAGLAISLIAVSLAYQRFVFRNAEDEPDPDPDGQGSEKTEEGEGS